MKLLIVEDNLKLAQTYKNALEASFDIYITATKKACEDVINDHKIDVILLDIMLPDGNGYDLIPWIKRKQDSIIIILSALEKEETRRIAYEKGADDYMIKPITLFELDYKLKALKKRFLSEKLILEIGDMILDLEKLTIATAIDEIAIQHSQGIVLKMLFEKHKTGDILTKKELSNLEAIEKTDNFRIHTLLSRLRKNMEKIHTERVFIENVYGEGYRLVVMK